MPKLVMVPTRRFNPFFGDSPQGIGMTKYLILLDLLKVNKVILVVLVKMA